MKSAILAAFAVIIGVDTAAHADCVGSICLRDEQPAGTQVGTKLPLERRIENALNDLEIYNARVDNESRTRGDPAWKQDR